MANQWAVPKEGDINVDKVDLKSVESIQEMSPGLKENQH